MGEIEEYFRNPTDISGDQSSRMFYPTFLIKKDKFYYHFEELNYMNYYYKTDSDYFLIS